MTGIASSELQRAALQFLGADNVDRIVDSLTAAVDPIPAECREAQNALRAAVDAADNAIRNGYVVNRVVKTSLGKDLRGAWPEAAVDNLRSAILFAGAGVDRALKALVEDALPKLVSHDENVQAKLQDYATRAITDVQLGVDPAALVRLLLGRGQTPQDILASNWVRQLTDGSAQSAERMEEIAAALGVIDPEIRKRLAANAGKSPSAVRQAFIERNKVAHELDITKPSADVRAPLERIRRRRSPGPVRKNCTDMLNAAQLVINDVAHRLDA